MKPTVLALLLSVFVALVPPRVPAPESPVEFDHVLLWVSPGAPERVALEKLGFRIAPTINRHEGQGTASCTVEFWNGFFEMIWPDSSVSIAPGNEFLRDRFRQRVEWRSSGRSPVGINVRRRSTTSDSLPFPTYPLHAPWLPPGEAMLRMMPLTDSLGATLTVSPRSLVIPPDSNLAWLIRGDPRAESIRHPNGCRKITGLRVIAPSRGLNEATAKLGRWNVVDFERGQDWCVELTLDRARLGKTADLRPALPLILKY